MTNLTDEQFLEKLIRLTWDEGYGYLKNYSSKDYDVKIKVHIITGDILLEINQDYMSMYSCSIERIIFDHEFIKVLCKLKNIHADGLMRDVILGNLATSTDRIAYLKKTFGGLVQ